MRHRAIAPGALLSALLLTASARAQDEHRWIDARIDSGPVSGSGAQRGVVHSAVFALPDAPWLRLGFEAIVLAAPPPGGAPSVLRLTSLQDGAVQRMTAEHLREWRSTSAYFNGDAVLVEIVADAGAGPSRLVIGGAWTAAAGGAATTTICGPTDDRVPIVEPRVGRVMPRMCSAWIMDDAQHCLLSAGHCVLDRTTVIEWNVPDSDAEGNEQHPPPEDQYAVDPSSVQLMSLGPGNDWACFGCFPNTNTGLTPAQAQGAWYELAAGAPPVEGQTLRVTGYGIDGTPPEWNRIAQTATGPYQALAGTIVHYVLDTLPGNSGSPVTDETTGLAIAIHTHGGCGPFSGTNLGTSLHHAALQAALARPQGVCVPACPADGDGPPRRAGQGVGPRGGHHR
jgi:hypothetical protein